MRNIRPKAACAREPSPRVCAQPLNRIADMEIEFSFTGYSD